MSVLEQIRTPVISKYDTIIGRVVLRNISKIIFEKGPLLHRYSPPVEANEPPLRSGKRLKLIGDTHNNKQAPSHVFLRQINTHQNHARGVVNRFNHADYTEHIPAHERIALVFLYVSVVTLFIILCCLSVRFCLPSFGPVGNTGHRQSAVSEFTPYAGKEHHERHSIPQNQPRQQREQQSQHQPMKLADLEKGLSENKLAYSDVEFIDDSDDDSHSIDISNVIEQVTDDGTFTEEEISEKLSRRESCPWGHPKTPIYNTKAKASSAPSLIQ